MREPRSAPGKRGFTLVELIAGLAITGALFAMALPSFARLIGEHKLLGEARRIAEGITLARSEAIKRNGHVVICATSATLPCGAARHWHEGWVVFADVDGNAEIDAGDSILGQDGASPAGMTAIGNRPVEQYLRFNYLGQARMVSGALQMGTIEVCKPDLRGYLVVLANSGRTRLDRMHGPCS